jgi:hypothetical protein
VRSDDAQRAQIRGGYAAKVACPRVPHWFHKTNVLFRTSLSDGTLRRD